MEHEYNDQTHQGENKDITVWYGSLSYFLTIFIPEHIVIKSRPASSPNVSVSYYSWIASLH